MAPSKITPRGSEGIELSGFFDTLGDYLAVQLASQGKNKVDDTRERSILSLPGR